MRKFLLAMLAAAAPSFAADGVQGTIDAYAQAFNSGDLKAWTSLCADKPVLIDDFAPHSWQGAGACTDWWNMFTAMTKKEGITGGALKLDKPWHLDTTGDAAYGVFPATFSYTKKGKAITDHGIWTLTLHKAAGGWKIATWTWAKH